MRPGQQKLKIPVQYVVLDAAGAILLGIGIAKVFAGMDLLPPAWRFEDYGITCVVGGILLMLPMVFHMIGVLRERQDRMPR